MGTQQAFAHDPPSGQRTQETRQVGSRLRVNLGACRGQQEAARGLESQGNLNSKVNEVQADIWVI